MDGRTLLNWGSYDVDNFGDQLFPFVVEQHMRRWYSRIVHVSPTGTPSIWPDAKATRTVQEVISAGPVAGLVIGGGNLLSWTVSTSINYVETPALARIVHPSFSWVPYVLLAKYGIPFAYNFVGVSKPIPEERRCLTKRVVEPAAFISCRDYASRERLQQAGIESSIDVGLDSAVDIVSVFSPTRMRDHYHSVARAKYGVPGNSRTAVVHLKARYLDGQLGEVARLLGFLKCQGIHPILVPLGICHCDDEILGDIRVSSSSATCIPRPGSLMDIISMLAASPYYIGSSLHGAIVSLTYGNAVALVANEKRSGLAKFSGFLSQVGLSRCLCETWSDALHALLDQGLAFLGSADLHTPAEVARRHDAWQRMHLALGEGVRAQSSIDLEAVVETAVREQFGI